MLRRHIIELAKLADHDFPAGDDAKISTYK
jgi:hypothetical protein